MDLWVDRRAFPGVLAVGTLNWLGEMLVLVAEVMVWTRLELLRLVVLLLKLIVDFRWNNSGFWEYLGESLTGVFSSAFILPLAAMVGEDLAFECRRLVGGVGLR